jgi:hydrogenase maturation protease
MPELQHPRVVVLACGNVSRGDDALGPLLLARIGALGRADLSTIEDYQLNIEHALDLEGADLALFIDAGTGTAAPFTFDEVAPPRTWSHSTHALEPAAVLATFAKVTGRPPPPAFVLTIRGEGFELGSPISERACGHLEEAWHFTLQLLDATDSGTWRRAAGADRPDGAVTSPTAAR